MNHPPIPPQCEFFREIPWPKGVWEFVGPGFHSILLSGAAGRDRKLIALVARGAWLDEAAARCMACMDETECFINSRAWEEWGRKA